MNCLMLENLHQLLKSQNFRNIVIFNTDKYSIDNIFEALKTTETFQRAEKAETLSPLPETQVQKSKNLWQVASKKRRLLNEKFYQVSCLQKECIVAHGINDLKECIMVVFCGFDHLETEKLGKKTLENIVEQAENCSIKVSQICFIHAGEITPHARDYIRIGHNQLKFQLFHVDFFRQNFMKYHLMPQMHVISEEEKKDLFAETNAIRLDSTQLPQIWHTDKIVRYFNANRKDIIYSTRYSINGQRYKYRMVTEEAKEKKTGKQIRKKEK